MRVRITIACGILLVTSLAFGQAIPPKSSATQPQKQQALEVTKEDFLTMPKIVSTSLSTFGVCLGMTLQEAIEALKSFCPQCSAKADTDDGGFDITVQNDDVLAVSVHFEDGQVDKVEWFPRMEKYLAGQSHKLLTPAAFTKDSALRLELLGREDNATSEVSDMSITQSFVYGKEGLRLRTKVAKISGQTFTNMVITLTKPAKVR